MVSLSVQKRRIANAERQARRDASKSGPSRLLSAAVGRRPDGSGAMRMARNIALALLALLVLGELASLLRHFWMTD